MPAVHAPEAAIQKNAVNSKLKKWAVARDFITCGSLFFMKDVGECRIIKGYYLIAGREKNA